jgi:hypothetical protein
MPFAIAKILESVPGVKRDGTALLVPEELDATAFVSLGQEVLQIPKVQRVELSTEISIATHRGERFFFPIENVVGLKLGKQETKNSHGAGFR